MEKLTVISVFALNCILVRFGAINGHDFGAKDETITDEPSRRTIFQEHTCITGVRRSPWRLFGFEYSTGIQQLHTDIEQFYKYMQPTSIERSMRMKVRARIETVVQDVWPDARIEVCGSFISGLALPNSDIDLMIIGASGRSPLRLLASKLLESGIAEPNSLRVKDDVRVPIIEFVDRESQLDIDMPLHNKPTLRVAPLINEFLRQYPALGKLVFVLKQYLRQRDLNDAFKGGISSYALTLMCISFLQKHPTYEPNGDTNLGELLLDFFELYGRKFDFENTGITTKNGGEYLPRNQMPCDDAQQLFCIGLNACSMSYRAPDVKEAFNDAYTILSMALKSCQNCTIDCAENSILGRIVEVSDDLINYRKWVRDNFDTTL